MEEALISSGNVKPFSLSHRMGEGRGEGSVFLNSPCYSCCLPLLGIACLSPALERFASNPPGQRGGCGDFFDHDDWLDINSVDSIKRDVTIWTSFAWKQNLPLSSTVLAMGFPNSKNTIQVGMLFSRVAGFWLNAFGIINSFAGRKGRILKRIFGRYCSLARHILRMLRYQSAGGRPICIQKKDPHPDPLPSDGRGNSIHASVINPDLRLLSVLCSKEGLRI